MIKIKLPTGTFEYDPNKPLGKRGGFGQVFEGRNSAGEAVAAKKLHVSASDVGHRELEIAAELKGRSFEHVMAFIDVGEDADTGGYFLVMPKADTSLQAVIDKEGKKTPTETATLMLQVIRGLLEVKDLVHRDLKPDNILLHQGKWKIADFGIARFMTEATSSNTLKAWLSAGYAAPEQWLQDRATNATDLYALGCIGVCLLTGMPPFTGETRQEHLSGPVPDFACADNRLKGLITSMLRKPPESRPSPSRVESFLAEIVSHPAASEPRGPFSAIAVVGAQLSAQLQEAEAKVAAERNALHAREQIAKAASEIMCGNIERLWGKLHKETLEVNRSSGSSTDFEVALGNATLSIRWSGYATPPGRLRKSAWDEVATGLALVSQHSPFYVWGASLWYAKIKDEPSYRWYEVGFFTPGGQTRKEPCMPIPIPISTGDYQHCQEPYAVIENVYEADRAISGVQCGTAIAYGPWLVDDENEAEFHNRWTWLLANAAEHKLRRPRQLPLQKWPPPM
jgi:eukaryotic-like serine/threonine-protein kinase